MTATRRAVPSPRYTPAPIPRTAPTAVAAALSREPAPGRRHAAGRRGKHARPADPFAITVKALSGPESPPVVGSHRAPGTLPIESWVRLRKPRQQ
ncbi:hypothetical protein AB0M20_16750, partial [Actinoplanes sp. NPDC051633]